MSSFQRLKLKNVDKIRSSSSSIEKTPKTKLGEMNRKVVSPIEEDRKKQFSRSVIEKRLDSNPPLTPYEVENSMFAGRTDYIKMRGTRTVKRFSNTSRSRFSSRQVVDSYENVVSKNSTKDRQSKTALESEDGVKSKGPLLICHLKHQHDLNCYTMSKNVRKSRSRTGSAQSLKRDDKRKEDKRRRDMKEPESCQDASEEEKTNKKETICGKDGAGTRYYKEPEPQPTICGKDGAGILPISTCVVPRPEIAVCGPPNTAKRPVKTRDIPMVSEDLFTKMKEENDVPNVPQNTGKSTRGKSKMKKDYVPDECYVNRTEPRKFWQDPNNNEDSHKTAPTNSSESSKKKNKVPERPKPSQKHPRDPSASVGMSRIPDDATFNSTPGAESTDLSSEVFDEVYEPKIYEFEIEHPSDCSSGRRGSVMGVAGEAMVHKPSECEQFDYSDVPSVGSSGSSASEEVEDLYKSGPEHSICETYVGDTTGSEYKRSVDNGDIYCHGEAGVAKTQRSEISENTLACYDSTLTIYSLVNTYVGDTSCPPSSRGSYSARSSRHNSGHDSKYPPTSKQYLEQKRIPHHGAGFSGGPTVFTNRRSKPSFPVYKSIPLKRSNIYNPRMRYGPKHDCCYQAPKGDDKTPSIGSGGYAERRKNRRKPIDDDLDSIAEKIKDFKKLFNVPKEQIIQSPFFPSSHQQQLLIPSPAATEAGVVHPTPALPPQLNPVPATTAAVTAATAGQTAAAAPAAAAQVPASAGPITYNYFYGGGQQPDQPQQPQTYCTGVTDNLNICHTCHGVIQPQQLSPTPQTPPKKEVTIVEEIETIEETTIRRTPEDKTRPKRSLLDTYEGQHHYQHGLVMEDDWASGSEVSVLFREWPTLSSFLSLPNTIPSHNPPRPFAPRSLHITPMPPMGIPKDFSQPPTPIHVINVPTFAAPPPKCQRKPVTYGMQYPNQDLEPPDSTPPALTPKGTVSRTPGTPGSPVTTPYQSHANSIPKSHTEQKPLDPNLLDPHCISGRSDVSSYYSDHIISSHIVDYFAVPHSGPSTAVPSIAGTPGVSPLNSQSVHEPDHFAASDSKCLSNQGSAPNSQINSRPSLQANSRTTSQANSRPLSVNNSRPISVPNSSQGSGPNTLQESAPSSEPGSDPKSKISSFAEHEQQEIKMSLFSADDSTKPSADSESEASNSGPILNKDNFMDFLKASIDNNEPASEVDEEEQADMMDKFSMFLQPLPDLDIGSQSEKDSSDYSSFDLTLSLSESGGEMHGFNAKAEQRVDSSIGLGLETDMSVGARVDLKAEMGTGASLGMDMEASAGAEMSMEMEMEISMGMAASASGSAETAVKASGSTQMGMEADMGGEMSMGMATGGSTQMGMEADMGGEMSMGMATGASATAQVGMEANAEIGMSMEMGASASAGAGMAIEQETLQKTACDKLEGYRSNCRRLFSRRQIGYADTRTDERDLESRLDQLRRSDNLANTDPIDDTRTSFNHQNETPLHPYSNLSTRNDTGYYAQNFRTGTFVYRPEHVDVRSHNYPRVFTRPSRWGFNYHRREVISWRPQSAPVVPDIARELRNSVAIHLSKLVDQQRISIANSSQSKRCCCHKNNNSMQMMPQMMPQTMGSQSMPMSQQQSFPQQNFQQQSFPQQFSQQNFPQQFYQQNFPQQFQQQNFPQQFQQQNFAQQMAGASSGSNKPMKITGANKAAVMEELKKNPAMLQKALPYIANGIIPPFLDLHKTDEKPAKRPTPPPKKKSTEKPKKEITVQPPKKTHKAFTNDELGEELNKMAGLPAMERPKRTELAPGERPLASAIATIMAVKKAANIMLGYRDKAAEKKLKKEKKAAARAAAEIKAENPPEHVGQEKMEMPGLDVVDIGLKVEDVGEEEDGGLVSLEVSHLDWAGGGNRNETYAPEQEFDDFAINLELTDEKGQNTKFLNERGEIILGGSANTSLVGAGEFNSNASSSKLSSDIYSYPTNIVGQLVEKYDDFVKSQSEGKMIADGVKAKRS